MNMPITVDIDEDALAILPTGTVPVITPLEESKRNDVFDIVGMERKFDEYQRHSDALKNLHKAWNDAYGVWGKRLDLVYGKVSAVDSSIAVTLGKKPGSEYEPFELVSVPTAITSVLAILGLGTSAYSAYKAYQALKAAKAAEVVVQADVNWARFNIATASVGFILSGYVAYRTVADRTGFLINALDSLADWFAEGKTQIDTMSGEINDRFIKEIRDIAVILGVDNPDNNAMFHAVVTKLNEAMTDAAEVEAQYKVATRMLCSENYNVVQTAAATGLNETVVQTLSDDIGEDPTICTPYRS